MAASECMHDGLPLLKGGIFRESAFLQKHCGAVEGKAYAFRRVCIGADGDKAASEIMIFLQNGFSGIGFGKAFFSGEVLSSSAFSRRISSQRIGSMTSAYFS